MITQVYFYKREV